MYLDFKVKTPSDSAGITRKKSKEQHTFATHISMLITLKRHTAPKSTSIGKCTEDDPESVLYLSEGTDAKEWKEKLYDCSSSNQRN